MVSSSRIDRASQGTKTLVDEIRNSPLQILKRREKNLPAIRAHCRIPTLPPPHHHVCGQWHPSRVSSGGGDMGWIGSGARRLRATHFLSCSQGPSGSDRCALCFFGWRELGRPVVSDTAAIQPTTTLSRPATLRPFSSCRLAGHFCGYAFRCYLEYYSSVAGWGHCMSDTYVPETNGHVCRSLPARSHRT